MPNHSARRTALGTPDLDSKERSTARPESRIPGTVWLGAAAVMLVHVAFAATMRGPLVQPDEGAYLGTAHFFAFGTGLLNTAAPYSPGYPLLLAPLSRLVGDPLATYHGALLVNAALHGSVVVSSYLLARRLVEHGSPARAATASILVACYASFLLVGNFATASSLVIAGTPALLVLVVLAWEQGEWWRWTLVGASATALAAVHPIGVVVAFAAVIGSCLGVRSVRSAVRQLGATALGAAPIALAVALLVGETRRSTAVARYVGARASETGDAQSRIGYTAGQIRDALELHNPRGLVVALAGQLFYLTVATFGLALVGIVLAARSTPRAVRDPSATPATRLRSLAGLALVGAIAASVLVINPPRSAPAHSLIYGRYNDQVVAPVLLVALMALPAIARPARRLVLAVLAVAAAVVVSGVVVLLAWPGGASLELVELQDVLGIYALANGLGRLDLSELAWIVPVFGVVTIGAFATILLAQRHLGTPGAAAVVGLGFVVPACLATVVLVNSSENRARETQLVAMMRERAEDRPRPIRCVGYLPDVEATWWLANYQFRLPELQFRVVTPTPHGAVTPHRCSRLILAYPANPAVAELGLVPVAAERTPEPTPVTLYVSPSRARDLVAQAARSRPAGRP